MSKYTTEQLQGMCKQYFDLEKQNDPRCAMFLMFISMTTGINQNEIIAAMRNMEYNGEWVF